MTYLGNISLLDQKKHGFLSPTSSLFSLCEKAQDMGKHVAVVENC